MLRRFIAALSVFMALAWHVPASAQTALQAPSIKWQGQYGTTQPVSFIGYDTGTGLPCIIGSSATCTITTTAGAGGSTVYGPTANGSPATSPPILVGGTANGTGTGNVTNWKIDTSGVGFVQFVSAQPVTATEADGANVTLGAKADAANCATANSLMACIRQLHADMIAATPAGEAHVGEVGGNAAAITTAQTVTASSAYTSGNAVGGLMTLANAARVTAGSGLIQSVIIDTKSAQTTSTDVILFNANPTGSTCTDKTAFAVVAADFDKIIGIAHVTDWTSLGTPSAGQAQNLAMPFALASGTTIYACAVTRGTPTFTATTDVSVTLRVLRN